MREYAEVPQTTREEDAESLLPDDKDFPNRQNQRPTRGSPLPSLLLLVLSHCLVAAIAVFVGSNWHFDPAAFCSHVTSRFCTYPFTLNRYALLLT